MFYFHGCLQYLNANRCKAFSFSENTVFFSERKMSCISFCSVKPGQPDKRLIGLTGAQVCEVWISFLIGCLVG